MNRRELLKILGLGGAAIVAEQVIPFNRVWSFPTTVVPAGRIALEPGFSLRYIRAFDPAYGHPDEEIMRRFPHGRMIHRIDVGDRRVWRPAIPPQLGADAGYVINNPTERPLVVALPNVDRRAVEMLKKYHAENPANEIFGVSYGIESAPLS